MSQNGLAWYFEADPDSLKPPVDRGCRKRLFDALVDEIRGPPGHKSDRISLKNARRAAFDVMYNLLMEKSELVSEARDEFFAFICEADRRESERRPLVWDSVV